MRQEARHERLAERFWSLVDRSDPDGCWTWTASTIGGYGRLKVSGRQERAHRVSWVLANGPIPSDLLVLHRCDVRTCVRPDHLWLGTAQDNVRDMIAKGRNARGDRSGARLHPERLARGDRHGARTHPERWLGRGGERASGAKLKLADVDWIRGQVGKIPVKALARQFGIDPKSIRRIRDGRTWKAAA